jgi:hypothetical protein
MHDKVTWEHANPLFAMPIAADQSAVDGHAIIYPDTSPDGAFQVRLPNGLDILITRIDFGAEDEGRTQLCISINTEEMGEKDHQPDPAGGLKPCMEVLLNDAVLYDEEPA